MYIFMFFSFYRYVYFIYLAYQNIILTRLPREAFPGEGLGLIRLKFNVCLVITDSHRCLLMQKHNAVVPHSLCNRLQWCIYYI